MNQVGLEEKVKNYMNNLDTYLTKEMPDGTELSGGEWQRIAIARGFLKDSDLILLDEPTAALDPITEMKIFEIFHALSKNITSITISHRIGPTRFSDRIIVMENGEIVEEGHFNELMSKKGIYYEMYKSQAKWYQEEKQTMGVG
ncbi:ATP-binding cassette domain-containing protein [Halalkalibacterium ligniniphilum]|uniref:ATP-binding cassette domain-containing protein n=1 Tax=Halalkalibacterium ligniniphilum TaxID=1134413 RepID=UPI00036464F0|nr:ATP-binding cassette domain-containing protein [Halalkalibacterium ligniniphilum]